MMVLSLYGPVTLATAQHAINELGPHGGQIGEADPFHVEMVTNESQLIIYLYNHDMKPLPLDKFQVSAIIQSGKERVKIDLLSAGESQMKGVSDLLAKPGAKIVLILKPKGKPQFQVRFGV